MHLPEIKAQETNPLQESLEQLDLKGLLVLNGIIVQQALKVILEAENVQAKFKQPIIKPVAF